ncbi:MAG: copper-binding protein [Hyphomicrobiales bacterium]|nr:copper-binding protein [Hyphomicrobiales bacterium]
MKKLCAFAVFLSTIALVTPVISQDAMVAGEVTKIDQATGHITIKHGPIKKFDMDGMTMSFKAGDPAMLTQVKPGDKIQFSPDTVNGKFTVTKIEKTK